MRPNSLGRICRQPIAGLFRLEEKYQIIFMYLEVHSNLILSTKYVATYIRFDRITTKLIYLLASPKLGQILKRLQQG